MSTVTLSKPHCAITSAEKPDGIASQAFTTVLPDAQICLTLFGIDRVSFSRSSRHDLYLSMIFFGKPVSTFPDRTLARGPLDADFADADVARGVHYRRPGIVRQ